MKGLVFWRIGVKKSYLCLGMNDLFFFLCHSRNAVLKVSLGELILFGRESITTFGM